MNDPFVPGNDPNTSWMERYLPELSFLGDQTNIKENVIERIMYYRRGARHVMLTINIDRRLLPSINNDGDVLVSTENCYLTSINEVLTRNFEGVKSIDRFAILVMNIAQVSVLMVMLIETWNSYETTGGIATKVVKSIICVPIAMVILSALIVKDFTDDMILDFKLLEWDEDNNRLNWDKSFFRVLFKLLFYPFYLLIYDGFKFGSFFKFAEWICSWVVFALSAMIIGSSNSFLDIFQNFAGMVVILSVDNLVAEIMHIQYTKILVTARDARGINVNATQIAMMHLLFSYSICSFILTILIVWL